MNDDIDVSARKADEEHIWSSGKLEIVWNTAPDDELQLVVEYVKIHNDKSQASLKVGGLTSCLLHNAVKFFRKNETASSFLGASVFGQLPVPFHSHIIYTI